MNKIRKGDEVIVRTGKDKGRRGTVLQVYADGRVLVEGINIVKKHTKPNPNIVRERRRCRHLRLGRARPRLWPGASSQQDQKDMSRLQEKYKAQLAGEIQQKLGLTNSQEVPRITKITLNMGVGEAVADKKVLEKARDDLEKISGQRPVTCLARKSVAAFKIRDGMAIGCKVTLRRERMYEFLDRLVNIAIPRIRDFRGLNPKSFDKQGNYSIGVSEQIIFPEINYDEIDAIRGLDITITTSARNAEEGKALLEAFNFPFKK
jgi:large subunit ribosomal protein L5